ncbi:hypothetical protein P8452_36173 [Trifolium repens]|nr:hypothetical protein P8452_36173 [Trifolium repens]
MNSENRSHFNRSTLSHDFSLNHKLQLTETKLSQTNRRQHQGSLNPNRSSVLKNRSSLISFQEFKKRCMFEILKQNFHGLFGFTKYGV